MSESKTKIMKRVTTWNCKTGHRSQTKNTKKKYQYICWKNEYFCQKVKQIMKRVTTWGCKTGHRNMNTYTERKMQDQVFPQFYLFEAWIFFKCCHDNFPVKTWARQVAPGPKDIPNQSAARPEPAGALFRYIIYFYFFYFLFF